MNPVAIELLSIIVEMLKSQQEQITALQDEEARETVDDASLTPRLSELMARLQMSAPAAAEMPDSGFGL